MKKAIMIQGTCSNAGKSLMVAGLCRILMQDGYKVAPFKAQNMSLNSFITRDGKEMGRAQVMQAEACNILPDSRMNPILLKPTSKDGSQVIVNGEVLGVLAARDFYAKKTMFRMEVEKAYDSLSKDYEIIVIEGAGSAAEINLMKDDIVNMGMAKMANAPVMIVGDIERGGVFASLAGTMLLFDDEERDRVKGVIINKFRGDASILEPGLKMLEDIIKIPVVGVVPYIDINVDDEDSLTERFDSKNIDCLIDIAVIKLPKISNFTDFNPLEYVDGVNVRYVSSAIELGNPDLLILPGTKNTMSDLFWLRDSGLEKLIIEYSKTKKPIIGICGGYQMLGQSLSDPNNVEHGGHMQGIGLLEHNTIFNNSKTKTSGEGILSDVTGIFSELSGEKYEGYEIHMGTSGDNKNIVNHGNVYGSYIHGIFDKGKITKKIIEALLKEKGLDYLGVKTFNINEYKQKQYDILAECLRKSLDMEFIYSLI